MPTVHLYKTFHGPVKNALTSMSFSLEEKCCCFLVSGGSYIAVAKLPRQNMWHINHLNPPEVTDSYVVCNENSGGYIIVL